MRRGEWKEQTAGKLEGYGTRNGPQETSDRHSTPQPRLFKPDGKSQPGGSSKQSPN